MSFHHKMRIDSVKTVHGKGRCRLKNSFKGIGILKRYGEISCLEISIKLIHEFITYLMEEAL